MADETKIIIDIEAKDNATQKVNKVTESLTQLANVNIKLIQTFTKVDDTVKSSMQYVDGVITKSTTKTISNFSLMQKAMKRTKDVFKINGKSIADTMIFDPSINDFRQKQSASDSARVFEEKFAKEDALAKQNTEAKNTNAAFENTNQNAKVLKNTTKKLSFTETIKSLKTVFTAIKDTINLIKKSITIIGSLLKKSGEWIENLSLFEATFGKNKQEAMEWSQVLVKNLGVGANEILKVTTLFKQMTKEIGMSEDISTKLGMTLPTLGLDISSFYNTSAEKANEMIRAAIEGQVKQGSQYGFDLSVSSLDEFLKEKLNMDYTSEVLSNSDQSLLRMVLLLEQSRDSWGAMAKNIPSCSNQLKMLVGGFENLKLAIGDALIAPATKIITFINGITIAITEMIRVFVPKKDNTGLNNVANEVNKIDEEVTNLEKSMGLLSFDKFESLSSGENNGISGATEGIEAEFNKLNAEYLAEFNKQMESITNKAKEIAETIKSWFMVTEDGKFVEWTDQAKGLAAIIVGIAGFGIAKGILKITGATGELSTAMKILQFAVKPMGLLIIGIAAALLYMYTTNEDFRNSVNNLVNTLLNLIGSIIEPIMSLLNMLMPILTTILDVLAEILTPIINLVAAVIDFLNYTGLLKAVLVLVAVAIAVVTLAVWANNVAWLANPVTWIILGIIAAIVVLTIIIKAFIDNIDKIWASIKNMARGVGNFFANIGIGIANLFISLVNLCIDFLNVLIAPITKIGSLLGKDWKIPKWEAEIAYNPIPVFAQGGYPEKGSMFVAGEAGAEIVANMGSGQSAVANIPQIEEAMYRALKHNRQDESQGGANNEITLRIETNDSAFARAIMPTLVRENIRIGKPLSR